jgi:prepilin-type N-terminal cleavage/methylation domain-containing protein
MTDRRTERGFTMVEVMIAILLTAIAVVGIMALFMTETRASSYSRHSTEATALAADKLEKLRTMSLPVGGSDTGLDPQGAAGGIFDRTWTVDTGNVSYTDVAVTVSWDENGNARTITMNARRQP